MRVSSALRSKGMGRGVGNVAQIWTGRQSSAQKSRRFSRVHETGPLSRLDAVGTLRASSGKQMNTGREFLRKHLRLSMLTGALLVTLTMMSGLSLYLVEERLIAVSGHAVTLVLLTT